MNTNVHMGTLRAILKMLGPHWTEILKQNLPRMVCSSS